MPFKMQATAGTTCSSFMTRSERSPSRSWLPNNRTALEIEIPFAGALTVENYLDVAKQVLGLSLDRTTYSELGTSVAPCVSVTGSCRSTLPAQDR